METEEPSRGGGSPRGGGRSPGGRGNGGRHSLGGSGSRRKSGGRGGGRSPRSGRGSPGGRGNGGGGHSAGRGGRGSPGGSGNGGGRHSPGRGGGSSNNFDRQSFRDNDRVHSQASPSDGGGGRGSQRSGRGHGGKRKRRGPGRKKQQPSKNVPKYPELWLLKEKEKADGVKYIPMDAKKYRSHDHLTFVEDHVVAPRSKEYIKTKEIKDPKKMKSERTRILDEVELAIKDQGYSFADYFEYYLRWIGVDEDLEAFSDDDPYYKALKTDPTVKADFAEMKKKLRKKLGVLLNADQEGAAQTGTPTAVNPDAPPVDSTTTEDGTIVAPVSPTATDHAINSMATSEGANVIAPVSPIPTDNGRLLMPADMSWTHDFTGTDEEFQKLRYFQKLIDSDKGSNCLRKLAEIARAVEEEDRSAVTINNGIQVFLDVRSKGKAKSYKEFCIEMYPKKVRYLILGPEELVQLLTRFSKTDPKLQDDEVTQPSLLHFFGIRGAQTDHFDTGVHLSPFVDINRIWEYLEKFAITYLTPDTDGTVTYSMEGIPFTPSIDQICDDVPNWEACPRSLVQKMKEFDEAADLLSGYGALYYAAKDRRVIPPKTKQFSSVVMLTGTAHCGPSGNGNRTVLFNVFQPKKFVGKPYDGTTQYAKAKLCFVLYEALDDRHKATFEEEERHFLLKRALEYIQESATYSAIDETYLFDPRVDEGMPYFHAMNTHNSASIAYMRQVDQLERDRMEYLATIDGDSSRLKAAAAEETEKAFENGKEFFRWMASADTGSALADAVASQRAQLVKEWEERDRLAEE